MNEPMSIILYNHLDIQSVRPNKYIISCKRLKKKSRKTYGSPMVTKARSAQLILPWEQITQEKA